MIESIAQGYAAKLLTSAVDRIFHSDRTNSTARTSLNSAATSGKTTGPDTIQLSAKSRLLAMNDLLLPTASNIQTLSAALSKDLNALFSEAGISTKPPVEIDVDEKTMDITVKGERPDKEKISALIDSNEKIKNQIRTLAAISSHAAGMEESLKFQKEYMASSNPEGVVQKYSALFNSQKVNDLSFLFDGSSIHTFSNGLEWTPSA